MKRALIALAAAAAISPTAFAGDVSWGGDANVEGFMVRTDIDATDTTDADMRGYTNRIRLKGTFKTDGNVSVNTRLILNDSDWTGDNHAGGVQGVYQNSANDSVAVDYGYIQAPIAGWTFRFGRQIANWANCFLTCDDRRDRILAMKRFGGTTVILLNDKRAGGSITSAAGGTVTAAWTDANLNGVYDAGEETGGFTQGTSTAYSADETADTGEGDLYVAAAVGVVKGWQWGLLVGQWLGEDGYILQDVYAISPFANGKIGPVKIKSAINILGGGNSETGSAFTDTAVSAYIKASMEVSSINLEAQAVIVQDGGLVAGGFDTFSMFVNNNPDNNQSNTAQINPTFGLVQALGGLGTIGESGKAFADDQYMLGFRASGKVGKFGWKASVTYLNTESNWDNSAADMYTSDLSLTTIEGGVTYAVAKTTELYLNVGMGTLEYDVSGIVASISGIDGDTDVDLQAATVGINTTF